MRNIIGSTRSIRNCAVAVIGGAGFLGSHLVNYLIEDRACDVLVIDNLVVGQREFIPKEAKFFHHDITGSEDYLRNLFDTYYVEYVFNYAAYPYIPDSFVRPLHVSNVNFFGAMKVINAAQEAGCAGILQVSSAELYGESGEYLSQLNENSTVKPHSSYGAAKAAIDYYCQCAWKERQTPVIALRQFNCVGERETHPYVVPEIISQLASPPSYQDSRAFSDPSYIPTIRLGNNSTRDFMYAGDAVRIAVELLERGEWGEVYNLGSESSISIYDLAKLIGKIMGFPDITVVEDESRKRPWEIWSLRSDNTKIQEATNYRRNILMPLEEALKRTINWFYNNGRKWPWER